MVLNLRLCGPRNYNRMIYRVIDFQTKTCSNPSLHMHVCIQSQQLRQSKTIRKHQKRNNKDYYKEKRNEVKKLIRTKKKAYFKRKLTEYIYKTKELWISLKSLGLKFESSVFKINCLENHKFEVKYLIKDFKVSTFRN